MALEDLMQAMKGFGEAAEKYGIATGIKDATAQMEQLTSDTTMDTSQKYTAQHQLANRLQGRLTGLGASGQQIAAAVGSIAPPDITTVAGAKSYAAQAINPEERVERNKLVASNVKAVGQENLEAKSPEANFENNLEMKRDRQKFDFQADLLGIKSKSKLSEEQKKQRGKAFDDINPYRRGNTGLLSYQKMKDAGGRIDALFSQFPDYNVPSNQTHELASTVAALVSGGSIQSQKQLDSITPSDIVGDANQIASWLTNNPRGLGQQKFMHALHDTSKREVETADNQLKFAQVQILEGKHSDLRKSDPEEYKRLLVDVLKINPGKIDATGMYDPARKDASSERPKPTPEQARALLRAREEARKSIGN